MSLGGQRVRVSGPSFLSKGGIRPACPLVCSNPVSSLNFPDNHGGMRWGALQDPVAGVTLSPRGLVGGPGLWHDRKHPGTLRP